MFSFSKCRQNLQKSNFHEKGWPKLMKYQNLHNNNGLVWHIVSTSSSFCLPSVSFFCIKCPCGLRNNRNNYSWNLGCRHINLLKTAFNTHFFIELFWNSCFLDHIEQVMRSPMFVKNNNIFPFFMVPHVNDDIMSKNPRNKLILLGF